MKPYNIFIADIEKPAKKAAEFIKYIKDQENITLIKYDIEDDEAQVIALFKSVTIPVIIFYEKTWTGFNPFIGKEISGELAINERKSGGFLVKSIDRLPLALSTVVISFVDGINPCSIWALLFLICMIIRFGSRKLILIVGLTYITVISVIYGSFVIGLF